MFLKKIYITIIVAMLMFQAFATQKFSFQIVHCELGKPLQDVLISNQYGIVVGISDVNGVCEFNYVPNAELTIHKLGFESKTISLKNSQINLCLKQKPYTFSEAVVEGKSDLYSMLRRLMLENVKLLPRNDTTVFYQISQLVVYPEDDLEGRFDCVLKINFKKGFQLKHFRVCNYSYSADLAFQNKQDSINMITDPTEFVKNHIVSKRIWKDKSRNTDDIIERKKVDGGTVFSLRGKQENNYIVREFEFDSANTLQSYNVFSILQKTDKVLGKEVVLKSFSIKYIFNEKESLLIDKVNISFLFYYKNTEVYFKTDIEMLKEATRECKDLKLNFSTLQYNYRQLKKQDEQ